MNLRNHHGQMSESLLTASFIILSGGLQDAYTYLCRGKVFANAQTGNIVLCSDIQDLIDFVAEYKDPDNYRWFFWESWLDIDMHRAEGENSFIDAMKSQLEDMAMEAMMDLSCLGYCLGL